MSILDIDGNDIERLNPSQLEELVLLLTQVELIAHDLSSGHAYGSGNNNAPDGGVDVRVEIPQNSFDTGYIRRPNTIFQVKSGKLGNRGIKKEMRPKGKLRDTISEVVKKSGSYVVVSSKSRCTDKTRREKSQYMKKILGSIQNNPNFHVEFIDQNRLCEWVNSHPTVCTWIKHTLGKEDSGWKPYGRWSDTPVDVDDSMILSSGVSITMPNGNKKLSIKDAIDPLRNIIRNSNKSIRIIGTSGLGKTRIVQSLFEREIGENALDHQVAIYADVGDSNSNCAPIDMVNKLMEKRAKAIIVLDNCSGILHRKIRKRIYSEKSNISLITIEFDTNEDNPEATEVITINSTGSVNIAKELILRRPLGIGREGAERIASAAGGNARLAVVLADNARNAENIGMLSDRQIFDNIFWQGNDRDQNLRKHAELLSLVYSFSISKSNGGVDELEILGSVIGVDRKSLKSSIIEMVNRNVIQIRSNYRAILPEAIANHIATNLLGHDDDVIVDDILEVLLVPSHERLLMSFCHRLGLISNHSSARKFATTFLQEGGVLSNPAALTNTQLKAFTYITPAAPEVALSRIAKEVDNIPHNLTRHTHLSWIYKIGESLEHIAKHTDKFEECVLLLARLAMLEEEIKKSGGFDIRLCKLFQPDNVTVNDLHFEKRASIIQNMIFSGNSSKRRIGILMMSATVEVAQYSSAAYIIDSIELRKSNFDYTNFDNIMSINNDDFVEWKLRFLSLAGEITIREETDSIWDIMVIIEAYIISHFKNKNLQSTILDICNRIYQRHGFVCGLWKSSRKLIYQHYLRYREHRTMYPIPDELVQLESAVSPKVIHEKIMAYLSSVDSEYHILAIRVGKKKSAKYMDPKKYVINKIRRLGYEFSISDQDPCTLKEYIFGSKSPSTRHTECSLSRAFGQGLAEGARCQGTYWGKLVDGLDRFGLDTFNWKVFSGFIEGVDDVDHESARDLLIECTEHRLLSSKSILLHPPKSFNGDDLSRCTNALQSVLHDIEILESLISKACYSEQIREFVFGWIVRILNKDYDVTGVIRALHFHSRTFDKTEHWIIILKLMTKYLRDVPDSSKKVKPSDIDVYISQLIPNALSRSFNDDEKEKWIDAIFSLIDNPYGHIEDFCYAVRETASRLPTFFLERIFCNDKVIQAKRVDFVRSGIMSDPPLGGIEVDVLIRWCRDSGKDEYWSIIASGIDAWELDNFGPFMILSLDAIKFLEESDNPKGVLCSYIGVSNYVPSSGTLSEDLYCIGPAIQSLTNHRDRKISGAAEFALKCLLESIQDASKREKFEREVLSQKFE